MVVKGSGYQEWATFLEQWRAGRPVDSRTLPPLAEQDYPGDSWVRLVRRITEALQDRLQAWVDALVRAVAEARDEFEVGRALTQARQGLVTIRGVAGHPGLPEALSRQLRDAVDEQIRSLQQALADGAEAARRDSADDRLIQARLRTIRDNPIDVTSRSACALGDGWATDPNRPTRRRIMTSPAPDRPED
ncbi:hypothetical protein [Micromonospora chersina]|uniref:hypothetical protein n=1 Tax=Micromonospora chersina TaxID=47854 RepID=UPI0033B46ED7